MAGKDLSREEMDHIDRGAEIQLQIWKEQKQEILEKYYEWVIQENLWQKTVDEFLPKELQSAAESLKLVEPGKKLSRSEANHILRQMSVEGKKLVFIHINQKMMEEIIYSMYMPEWPIERWKNTYGKHRIIWPVVHMPLAEDLEPQRISAIAKLGGSKRPETAILFERIQSLEANLHRKLEQVQKQEELLAEVRAEKARIEERLSGAYDEIRKLRSQVQELKQGQKEVQLLPERKLEGLKGIIAEMREELKKRPSAQPVTQAILDEKEPIAVEDVKSALTDKVVGIIGGHRYEQTGKFPNVITASGDESSVEFENLLRKSEVLVVLTQHVSHSAMWAAKAYAIEYDKPILFTKHINIPIILKEVDFTDAP